MWLCMGGEADVAILVRRLAVMGVFNRVEEALVYRHSFCTACVCWKIMPMSISWWN